ncbi:hypothetical protein [Streptomyces sviceus]|uniref:hypothetical protein n=1 Tax=Streptomyces sviceus TaxID=285530 RepID=UPI003317B13F
MLLAEVDLIRTFAAKVGVILRIDLQQRPGDNIPCREALSAALDLPLIDPNRQRHDAIVRRATGAPQGLAHDL